MIDWFNFWIWAIPFAMTTLLAVKVVFKPTYGQFGITLFAVVFAVVWTFITPPVQIEYNPDLHECTLGDFLIQDNQNGNWHCSFYDEGIYDTGLRVSHITGEKEPISECVSFRAKTECEKGNPKYVLENITRVNPDEIDKNCAATDSGLYWCFEVGNPELNIVVGGKELEHPTMSEIFYTEQVCREKSFDELEADYCKENPTDTIRCSCVENVKMFEACNKYGCMTGETEAWDWNGSSINHEPLKTLTKNYTGKCVRAVPVSEKTYCDGNPRDSEKCGCIEYSYLCKNDVTVVKSYESGEEDYREEDFYYKTNFSDCSIKNLEYCWEDYMLDSKVKKCSNVSFGGGSFKGRNCVRAEPKSDIKKT